MRNLKHCSSLRKFCGRDQNGDQAPSTVQLGCSNSMSYTLPRFILSPFLCSRHETTDRHFAKCAVFWISWFQGSVFVSTTIELAEESIGPLHRPLEKYTDLTSSKNKPTCPDETDARSYAALPCLSGFPDRRTVAPGPALMLRVRGQLNQNFTDLLFRTAI